jgi:O-antigen ligase/tetratricopeptide (TPR) repeat protein
MMSTSTSYEPLPPYSTTRIRAIAFLRAAMESTVLLMVCAAPWVYGAVHPGFELLLFVGVSLVVVLWGLRMLLGGCFVWKKCPVALCLAGLFLIGVWQRTPLSKSVLAWVAPGTSRLYDQLLPAHPEVVSPDESLPTAAVSAGRTISLYPNGTRIELVRLLAVFLIFAAVRNTLADEGGLRRLSIAAVINGAALSFFALVQFFSSPPNVLYWSYPSLGRVFGPFICRNHFSFYVNLCIGLGIGLLLSRNALATSEQDRSKAGRRGLSFPLLRDPITLWICVALALMVSAVAVSLSRGGFVALLGAVAVCLFFLRARSTLFQRGGTALIIAALAVLLASWLGFGQIKERLETLGKEDAVLNRLTLWRHTAALVKDVPVWGTGWGTFRYTERLSRASTEDEGVAEHAHNDYLEVLLEAGIPGLLLSLLAVGLVFRLGYRAFQQAPPSGAGLALGALFAFTTLVLQSFVDFGVHIPAITLLAAVLSAHLCGLSGGDRKQKSEGIPEERGRAVSGEYRFRLRGIAPVLGAAAGIALSFVLCSAGWQAHRVDRLRIRSDRLEQRGDPADLARQVACLEQASRLAPEDAELQVELGRVRIKLFEEESGHRRQASTAAALAGATAQANRFEGFVALACTLAAMEEGLAVRTQQRQLVREYLFPALRNYLNARDRCPLLCESHLILATYAARLSHADTRVAYLERVELLADGDSEIWYRCGIQELAAKRSQRAWACWRRCLELSDRYLAPILEVSVRVLRPEEMVEAVLPDRPRCLLNAALRLYPEAGAAEQRRPFLKKILRVLEVRTVPLNLEELHVKARTHKYLEQRDEAVAAYRELLAEQPRHTEGRFELAQVLQEQGKLEEARRALTILLNQQPEHAQARELLTLVLHELTRKQGHH